MKTDSVIEWLLEESNPAVRYRTQTEILGQPGDKKPIMQWLDKNTPADLQERKQGIFRHYLAAVSECGLSYKDIKWKKEKMIRYGENIRFDQGCGDYLHLRSLVRLGLAGEPVVAETMNRLAERRLPDGGFLCLHRLDKLNYIPKSCVKANMAALMFCAECKKKGMETAIEEQLVNYFWNHNLFYRTDNPAKLILDSRKGWRTIDTFYPFEVMRVGLHNIVESFCAMGYGSDPRLNRAWEMLESKKTIDGKYILDGAMTKSYLPRERTGKPSKWVTFYALLAKKESAD